MVQTHQASREEGTTKPIPPQETEKIWHGSSKSSTAAPSRASCWLHHCLVWQLLGLRPQDTIEGSAHSPVHHWGHASCHPGPLYQAVSEEVPKNCQRLQPPWSWTVLSVMVRVRVCTASGTGAPSQGPKGFLTTPEHLLKGLPRPLFYVAATLC